MLLKLLLLQVLFLKVLLLQLESQDFFSLGGGQLLRELEAGGRVGETLLAHCLLSTKLGRIVMEGVLLLAEGEASSIRFASSLHVFNARVFGFRELLQGLPGARVEVEWPYGGSVWTYPILVWMLL